MRANFMLLLDLIRRTETREKAAIAPQRDAPATIEMRAVPGANAADLARLMEILAGPEAALRLLDGGQSIFTRLIGFSQAREDARSNKRLERFA